MNCMPERHALLGPSGAARWLNCTPSARLEEGLPGQESVYAREGTLAHHMAEILLRGLYEGQNGEDAYHTIMADELYSPSMREDVNAYVDYVTGVLADARNRCADPSLFIEQEIDLSDYVPEGFGTADCVVIADGVMDVIDLKYGKGIAVDADKNPQMMLYALGCLSAFDCMYDIQTVRMTIYQPRLNNVSSFTMTTEDLRTWGENMVKPTAALAWAGEGEYAPSPETCKWCRARAQCRALAEYEMEQTKRDFDEPALLAPTEIAEVLSAGAGFVEWYNAVKEYALDAAENRGEKFPGWKLVEGRSNRVYTDEKAVAKALKAEGYATADIYKPRTLRGLTELERQIGKRQLGEILGDLITKPAGKPTLVPASDKRPEISSAARAAEDFTDAPDI